MDSGQSITSQSKPRACKGATNLNHHPLGHSALETPWSTRETWSSLRKWHWRELAFPMEVLLQSVWSPEMAALGPSEELLPDILLPRPPDFIRSMMQSPKQSHTISQHHIGKAPAETVFHSLVPPKLEQLTPRSPEAPGGSVLSCLFSVPVAFHTALTWGPITSVTFSNQKVQPRKV